MTSAQVADQLLVNETILDNQIMHGEVRCFLKYADTSLRGGHDNDSPVVSLLKSSYQCVRVTLLWLFHQLCISSGQGKNHMFEQVPFQPVNVWLSWSVAFASQGLGGWIKGFSVSEDPRGQPGYDDMTAEERFGKRAEYFASEVLSSAWLQLWAELLLGSKSASPLHWGT